MTTTTTASTSTASTAPTVEEPNGIPLQKLLATRERVRNEPELAAFRFTARNTWVEGTAATSSITEWYGVGSNHEYPEEYTATADHPTLGHGHGPAPHEFVLHALASCVTAGIVMTAAARGIELESVESVVEADIDVRGVLGVDHDVRKGFSDVRCDFTIRADADEEQLLALIDAGRKSSATYDMLTNPTPVSIVGRKA